MGSSYTPPVNLASPGAIGGTTPAAITGTTITANTKVVAPSGSVAAAAVQVGSSAGRGLSEVSSQLRLSNNGTNYVAVANGYLDLVDGATYLRTHYGANDANPSIGLYYLTLGFQPVSASEGKLIANATTIARWKDAVGFIIDVGGLLMPKTITAGGTTGAQTINKAMGQVNFAAAATTLVVTNSLVDANSIVLAQVLGTDATAVSVRVTKASGSFTLTLPAAATAETAVEFIVLN